MKSIAEEKLKNQILMTKNEFEQRLRNIGAERYHDNCRFHHLLHSGKLNKGQVQACLLYTSPSPRDGFTSRMPSSA